MCQAIELPVPTYSILLKSSLDFEEKEPRPLDRMPCEDFTWLSSGRTSVCRFLAQEACFPLATCTGQRQRSYLVKLRRPLSVSSWEPRGRSSSILGWLWCHPVTRSPPSAEAAVSVPGLPFSQQYLSPPSLALNLTGVFPVSYLMDQSPSPVSLSRICPLLSLLPPHLT